MLLAYVGSDINLTYACAVTWELRFYLKTEMGFFSVIKDLVTKFCNIQAPFKVVTANKLRISRNAFIKIPLKLR